MSLIEAAREVRENAWAPYSRFKVGAALRAASGRVYVGCNVENVAYPEGTCAEAGAIAAMVAAGDTRIVEIVVVADSPTPVAPCGGCRQKIAEFAAPDATVTMATTDGTVLTRSVADILPGAFDAQQMERAGRPGLLIDAKSIIGDLVTRGGLDEAEARWFAAGLADGTVTDAQAGAFAMAVRLRGLGPEGRAGLTAAMRDTGRVLSWDLPGPVVDKHSTGGIGDCVSLPLAPALAACGVFVPMVSGRGLGHTGGTLDKLEAIPGFDVELTEHEFRQAVREVGTAIVAASPEIAPADRRLYAIRDVTGTVESIDLITASILSKKLAAGLDALVLDVKAGSGAFLPDLDDARALARSLVETAEAAGCRTAALITAMDQPLAPCAGNAVEVVASMEALEGASGPLRDLTVALGGVLLGLAGVAGGEARIAATLDDGSALERFARMVRVQDGPPDFAETWRRHLPQAPVVRDVPAGQGGVVSAIDGRALGTAVIRLGGGRLRGGERLDHSVGLDRIVRLGDRVDPGDPLARVHAATDAAAVAAAADIRAAIEIGEGPAEPLPLVIERIGA